MAGPCGGCSLRHLDYAAELRAKQEKVADAFARIGGLDVPVLPIVGSPEVNRYRCLLYTSPKQKKMWDNILTVIMTLLSLLWIYPIVLILLNLSLIHIFPYSDWNDYIGKAAPVYLNDYSRMQLQHTKISMCF